MLLGFTVRLSGDAEGAAVRAIMSIEVRSADMRAVVAALGGCPRSGGCIRPTAAGTWWRRSTPPTSPRSTATLTAIRALKAVANSETSILLAELK